MTAVDAYDRATATLGATAGVWTLGTRCLVGLWVKRGEGHPLILATHQQGFLVRGSGDTWEAALDAAGVRR